MAVALRRTELIGIRPLAILEPGGLVFADLLRCWPLRERGVEGLHGALDVDLQCPQIGTRGGKLLLSCCRHLLPRLLIPPRDARHRVADRGELIAHVGRLLPPAVGRCRLGLLCRLGIPRL